MACSNSAGLSTPESLIRPERFRRALAALRQEFGAEAKVSNFRLAPERIDAQLVRGERRTTLIQLDSDAEETFRTELETASDNTLPLSRLDPRGPDRLMRKALRRYGVKLADLSYMTVTTSASDGKPGWVAFMKDSDRFFLARLDGGKVRAQDG